MSAVRQAFDLCEVRCQWARYGGLEKVPVMSKSSDRRQAPSIIISELTCYLYSRLSMHNNGSGRFRARISGKQGERVAEEARPESQSRPGSSSLEGRLPSVIA